MLIVIEGMDGSGKTTQVELLRQRMPNTIVYREPGGTPLSEKIRDLILTQDHSSSWVTDLFLFMAARAQLMIKVAIDLADEKVVILDRWAYSTYAYQQQLDYTDWVNCTRLATRGIVPDLSILLDVDPAIAMNRIEARKKDRFESKGLDFYTRVRGRYLQLGLKTIDASRSVDQVHTDIMNLVQKCQPLTLGTIRP